MKYRNRMILNCEQGTICKPSSDAQNRDHSWPRPTRLQHTIRGQHHTAGAGVNRTLSMTVGCVRGPVLQAVGFSLLFALEVTLGESNDLLALFEASWKACWMDGWIWSHI